MENEKPSNTKESLHKLTDLAQDFWPENKWAFLYSYSRKALDEEIDRFRIIDDKSVKLLSSVSIIITVFVALFKWLIEGNKADYSIYVYVIASAIFFSLCFAWYYFFRALKLLLTPRMPLNDETFKLVKENNIATIHVSLSKSCKDAVEESRVIIENKAQKIKFGYSATSISAILLVIFICMVSYEYSIQNEVITQQHNHKEALFMGDNEKQTTSEPDLDIPAQDLQYSTEGLEISNDATNVEILNESD